MGRCPLREMYEATETHRYDRLLLSRWSIGRWVGLAASCCQIAVKLLSSCCQIAVKCCFSLHLPRTFSGGGGNLSFAPPGPLQVPQAPVPSFSFPLPPLSFTVTLENQDRRRPVIQEISPLVGTPISVQHVQQILQIGSPKCAGTTKLNLTNLPI